MSSEPAEPMQRALDAWHRDQPEAFAREPEPSDEENPASAAEDNLVGGAERAIALHHLLAYGRLAAEQDLAALRKRAAADGSPVLAPLLRQTEVRTAQLLEAAPSELHPSLSAGFAPTADALAEKAAAIDALTAERRRAGALAQSIELAEALLRQDPEQYEVLAADAGTMADGLGLDETQHRMLMGRMRERFAAATLLAQLDPLTGDPDQADQDLRRGRFRDAFDAAGIAAWRELVAASRARRQAETMLAARDAGIVAEIKMLNRLAAAGRAEAPMPPPVEVETVFPGEGAARLAAAARNRTGALYADEIATQPFDKDSAWIEAATGEEDRALRTEAVQRKHREFARSGGGNLLAQYPALGAAVEEGLQDPSKLDLAIELYQRQLAKLGVPPEMRALLPADALAALAGQYHAQATPAAKVDWLRRLADAAGEERAHAVLRALEGLPHGVPAAAPRALYAQLAPSGRQLAESIITESRLLPVPALGPLGKLRELAVWGSREGVREHYQDFIGANAAIAEAFHSNLPGIVDGPADAYRHILWAAELTRRFGEERAREILELNEVRGTIEHEQDADSLKMDRHNNEIGVRLGRRADTWEDVVARARAVITVSGQYGGGLDVEDRLDRQDDIAAWLGPTRWGKDRVDRTGEIVLPFERMNWFSNPDRPSGIDWIAGISPNPYRYSYGSISGKSDPNEDELLTAIGLLKAEISSKREGSRY